MNVDNKQIINFHKLLYNQVVFHLCLLIVFVHVSSAQVPPGQIKVETATGEDIEQSDLKEITLKNADISTIVRIFSKRTKRNFILDEKVRGTVTVYLPGEIPKETEMKILDSILALKGFTTVPISKNLWKVIPAKEASKSTVPMRESDSTTPTTGSVVTTLVSLNHVSANDVHALINQMVSPEGMVQVYATNNSLVIVDYDTNVERLIELIHSLDIPAADSEMTIIPILHAEATDVAEKLTAILNENSNSDTNIGRSIPGNPAIRMQNPNGQNMPMGINAAGTLQTRREPKIIADERTNSIIVVADLDTTARIRALASELDSEVDRSGSKYYVYRCQHANAAALAEVLSGSTGSSGSGIGGTQNSGDGFNNSGTGGLGNNNNQQRFGNRGSNRLNQNRNSLGSRGGSTNPASNGATSVQIDENTSITADPATNSLIISASEGAYHKILSLLKELDIKRRQVLVEAVILEVSVDESTQIGTDWLSSTGGADGGVLASSNFGGAQGLQGLLSDPTRLAGFSVAAASAGSLRLPGGTVIPSQTAILNAAQNNSKVNVLSSPTLLGTDNEEAQIVVGQNVPFLASTSTNQTNLDNTFNQIDRQDVGITLRITPQINSNDYVTLRVFTDVSAVIPSADSTLGPTTTVRSSETTIIVKDSQMIAIGGLISDENSDSKAGIPILKDIPLIGDAFRRASEDRSRTNLLTFITPHIIHDQFDARDHSVYKRNDLRGEINRQNVKPNREDILSRDALHNVAEISASELPVPEPIIPSKADIENARAKLGANKISSTNNTEVYADELPIEAEVETMLPTTENSGNTGDVASRYAVIKVHATSAIRNSLPFPINKEGLCILQLAEESSQDFFSQSKSRTYKLGDKNVPIEILASFNSESKARDVFSEDKLETYMLSSYEIMNLGNGPWLK